MDVRNQNLQFSVLLYCQITKFLLVVIQIKSFGMRTQKSFQFEIALKNLSFSKLNWLFGTKTFLIDKNRKYSRFYLLI